MSPHCGWLVTAFDSEIPDPRDYLNTEYGGLTLHIKPGHDDAVSAISVFLEDRDNSHDAQLVINRFLSAMAWKESSAFVTLGAIIGGAYPTERDEPRFNYNEGRVLRGGVISRFDFEHLQNPTEDKQKLALALYREGLNSNTDFYRFLSFYKIINIGFANGHEQAAWINANLGKIWNYQAEPRLKELQSTGEDVGSYLLRQGRDAIAHAYSQPILDPDLPTDRASVKRNVDLMQGLAEVFIQEELGAPSQRKIWAEHLYELEGFKRLFGDALALRLKVKESVSIKEFPAIPPLTLNLKEQPPYECLNALIFQITVCKDGVVYLSTDPLSHPMQVLLALRFPDERLELVISRFGINSKQKDHTIALAVSYWRFLIAYYCNGCLQVFDSRTGKRLSHKTAFVAQDIDLHATVEAFKKKIEELEAQTPKG
jgi:hypothetical protein